MEKTFKMKYFRSICDRYHQVSRRCKAKILDEFCKVCGYNRKYAIAKLNGVNNDEQHYRQQRQKAVRQRPKIYSDQTIELIAKIWEAAQYPCSGRLKAIIPLWLPWIKKKFVIDEQATGQLLGISPRQMERRLQKLKRKAKQRIYGGTKPGTLLKHQIPIKTDHWDVQEPGFTEIDTVSHSGNCASGEFGYSVNQTDILTGWVETYAVLGKGEVVVSDAIDAMEQAFPFKLKGIDSDNGSEFINHHLQKKCQQKNIQFTRGRPYKKDDNAHIEQKNWTHVRKIFGWNRYDTKAAVAAMNNLYRNELRLFMNLFLPSTKLLQKKRIGSRLYRQYDKPQTPLDRVIASGKGDPIKIKQMTELRNKLDPFTLSRIINDKIERIVRLANYRQSPKATDKKTAQPSTKKTTQNLSPSEMSVYQEISQMFGIEVKANGKKVPAHQVGHG